MEMLGLGQPPLRRSWRSPARFEETKGAPCGSAPGMAIWTSGPRTPDRPSYYFNKGIRVDTGLMGSHNENLSLQTAGTTRVTVLSSNGNVGIATASPQAKLEVNGTFRLTPTSRPSNPSAGTTYFDARDKHIYTFNGTAWKRLDN